MRLIFDQKNKAHLPRSKDESSTQGWSALHMAADLGNAELVKLFMASGVDVNRDIDKSSSGTALAYAAEQWSTDSTGSYKQIVQLMVDYEETDIENLVVSGGAVQGFSPEAADLMFTKAQSRGFDPDAAVAEDCTDKDTQALARKRYNKWLAKKATPAASTGPTAEELKAEADAKEKQVADEEAQRKLELEKKLKAEEDEKATAEEEARVKAAKYI